MQNESDEGKVTYFTTDNIGKSRSRRPRSLSSKRQENIASRVRALSGGVLLYSRYLGSPQQR